MPEMWEIRGDERREKMREYLRLTFEGAVIQALEKFDEGYDEWDWAYADESDEYTSSPEYMLEWVDDCVRLRNFRGKSFLYDLYDALRKTEHIPDEDEVDSLILFMVKNKCNTLDDLRALSERLEAEA